MTIGTRQPAVGPVSRNQLAGKNSASNPVSKKIFCLTLSALLLAHSFPAAAQQPAKLSRIGYLSANDPSSEPTRSEAIRQGLRDLGYIEGQNIAIEYRYPYAEGKQDQYPELAAELVRIKVDIIVVAGGAGMVRAAKTATKTIPSL